MSSRRQRDRRSPEAESRRIWAAIAALEEPGCAIVIVDKNLNDVGRLAERMILLEKRRVAWSGPSATLCGEEALQRRYLGV